jgi:solute carrier family 25 phosphate transporter 3
MQTCDAKLGPAAAAAAVLRSPEGTKAFLNGAGATAIGYWMQGAAKFGGYEFCKHMIFRRKGEGDAALSRPLRLSVMISSAAAAEMMATFFLCPFELAKLRLQTDSSCRAFGLAGTLLSIARVEGPRALWKGFGPVAMRQVPYTCCKLVVYELASLAMLDALRRLPEERASLGAQMRPAAVVAAGLVAGAAAAVISQPADVLLSRLCGSGAMTSLSACVIAQGPLDQISYLCSIGFRECFSGLAPRLMMISSMTSLQFLVYDSLRQRLGCLRGSE